MSLAKKLFSKTYKGVPVFALALVLSVALGAGALLNVYGTFTGAATVDQAVQLENPDHSWMVCTGGSGEGCTYDMFSDATAGETKINELKMRNQGAYEEEVAFETTCGRENGGEQTETNNNDITWGDGCEGIHTRYVEYFDDAGADIESYSYDESDCDIDVTSGTLSDLQTAVDNTDNDVVCFTGSYSGQLEITEDVTLKGHDGATIEAVDGLENKTWSSTDRRPVVYVNSADATIENVVVDGLKKGDNSNYGFIGVLFHNAGGKVDHLEITGIMEDPHSGDQHGVALYAYNGDSSPRTLSVTNNHIHDYQKNAMALKGSNLEVSVRNNLVEGVGTTGITAQNGIQVSSDATGEIVGNTVKGNDYNCPDGKSGDDRTCDGDETNGNEDDWEASGILIYGTSGTVEVKNNSVHGNGMNIYTDSSATISRNNIYDPDPYYTSVTSSNSSVTADNNYWGTQGIEIGDDYNTASWKLKDLPKTLDSGEVDKFGAINEFAINLMEDTYDLETDIVPQ